MSLNLLITQSFQTLVSSESGRILVTVAIVLTGMVASKLWVKYLSKTANAAHPDKSRQKLVWAKNLIVIACIILIGGLWASKLAGMILSLAAVAGAMLIVSKELIMCVLGYGLYTLSKPFRIGDYVEIGGLSGRVIDMDVFCTTLAETGDVRQLTGKAITMPNAMLLAQSVRNISATGAYMINLYPITLTANVDIDLAEKCALKAALNVTREWQHKAEVHLKRIETDAFLDLPSSKPKVLWHTKDEKALVMTIRFSCPVEERVFSEQAIFRAFWNGYQTAIKEKSFTSEEVKL